MNKIILCALNSKYIQSNLAVYELQAYAKQSFDRCDITICEYTINQPVDEIMSDLYQRHPDIIAFSCYVWNISEIYQVTEELKKIMPQTLILLGGPEVSYDATDILQKHEQIDAVISGEGELSFAAISEGRLPWEEIGNLTFRRQEDGFIVSNPPARLLEMDELPFIYDDLTPFANKMIYYESTRGCPFGCSYCLSSTSTCVRYRSMDKVLSEIDYFLANQVKQVKFVDRTFNCNHQRTKAILKHLLEKDQGKTNFHFEISADLMDEEELELLSRMRPGLVQLEIGVQTINQQSITAIHRSMNLDQLSDHVTKIHQTHNIHQHLDLIAGLPYEDIYSFQRSFDYVYALAPDQLQLGFLKVLKGSEMSNKAFEYGIVYQNRAPYEVLYTKWMSYDDMILLKQIEEMVEIYYNSGQYVNTLSFWNRYFDSSFEMFRYLVEYYLKNFLFSQSQSRISQYHILYQCMMDFFAQEQENRKVFIEEEMPEREKAVQIAKELLLYDLYLRENLKTRPQFAKDVVDIKKAQHILRNQKELTKNCHVEWFDKEMLPFLTVDYPETETQQAEEWNSLFQQHLADDLQSQKARGRYLCIFDYDRRTVLYLSAHTYAIF